MILVKDCREFFFKLTFSIRGKILEPRLEMSKDLIKIFKTSLDQGLICLKITVRAYNFVTEKKRIFTVILNELRYKIEETDVNPVPARTAV